MVGSLPAGDRTAPAQLHRNAATALYARAIAESLELDAGRRRVPLDAATHLGNAKRLTRIEDFERVMQTVLHRRERWDGQGGFPGLLRGRAIPLESRVLAVAEALACDDRGGRAGPSTRPQATWAPVPRAGHRVRPKVVPRLRGGAVVYCRAELESTRPIGPAPHESHQEGDEFGAFGHPDAGPTRLQAPRHRPTMTSEEPLEVLTLIQTPDPSARGSCASRSASAPVARPRSSRW